MDLHQITKCCAGCSLALSALVGVNAKADVSLFELGINRDGVISTVPGDPLPAGSVFDTTTGLGHIRLVFATAGPHSGVLYVDHELSEAVNTFFNELGSVSGAPSAGQSWEIDEPGFSSSPGDIYDNFLVDSLDNSVGKSKEDDVSMALGWSFVLAPGDTATLGFLISDTAPNGGFYLKQTDPDSGEALYFSSYLDVSGGPVIVPEGQSIVAGGILALLAAGGVWRNRRNQTAKPV